MPPANGTRPPRLRPWVLTLRVEPGKRTDVKVAHNAASAEESAQAYALSVEALKLAEPLRRLMRESERARSVA